MRTLYFGKHIKPDGTFHYTTVRLEGRSTALKHLRQYNNHGWELIGCRKRILTPEAWMELIENINDGDDTLRCKYFESQK